MTHFLCVPISRHWLRQSPRDALPLPWPAAFTGHPNCSGLFSSFLRGASRKRPGRAPESQERGRGRSGRRSIGGGGQASPVSRRPFRDPRSRRSEPVVSRRRTARTSLASLRAWPEWNRGGQRLPRSASSRGARTARGWPPGSAQLPPGSHCHSRMCLCTVPGESGSCRTQLGLHRSVMLENHGNLAFLGYQPTKPDTIFQLEHGELWMVQAQVPSPGLSDKACEIDDHVECYQENRDKMGSVSDCCERPAFAALCLLTTARVPARQKLHKCGTCGESLKHNVDLNSNYVGKNPNGFYAQRESFFHSKHEQTLFGVKYCESNGSGKIVNKKPLLMR